MAREGPRLDVAAGPDGSAVVDLPESPTTGYRWELADPGQSRFVTDSRYRPDPAPGPVAGGGGLRRLQVDLSDEAEVELTFQLLHLGAGEPVETRVVAVRRPGPAPS